MSYVQTCNYRLVNLRVTVVFVVVVVGSGGGVGVGVAVAVAAVVVLTLTHRQIESVVTNRTDPNIQEWKSISEKKKTTKRVYSRCRPFTVCFRAFKARRHTARCRSSWWPQGRRACGIASRWVVCHVLGPGSCPLAPYVIRRIPQVCIQPI